VSPQAGDNGKYYDAAPYAAARQQAERNFNDQNHEIAINEADKVADERRKAELKIQAEESAIRQASLKMQGRDLDAELEQLKEKSAEQLAVILETWKKREKEHPDDADEIARQAKREAFLVGQSELVNSDAAIKKDREQQAKRMVDADRNACKRADDI